MNNDEFLYNLGKEVTKKIYNMLCNNTYLCTHQYIIKYNGKDDNDDWNSKDDLLYGDIIIYKNNKPWKTINIDVKSGLENKVFISLNSAMNFNGWYFLCEIESPIDISDIKIKRTTIIRSQSIRAYMLKVQQSNALQKASSGSDGYYFNPVKLYKSIELNNFITMLVNNKL